MTISDHEVEIIKDVLQAQLNWQFNRHGLNTRVLKSENPEHDMLIEIQGGDASAVPEIIEEVRTLNKRINAEFTHNGIEIA